MAVRGRLVELVTAVLERDIGDLVFCAGKDMAQEQLLMRYATDRALRWVLIRGVLSQQLDGFAAITHFVVDKMAHNAAQFNVPAFNAVRGLEFPARSEALEILSFVLGSREKMPLVTKELVAQMVAANFVKRERKLVDAAEHVLLIESSMEVLSVVLRCEAGFPPAFVREASAFLDSLRTRFHGEWAPAVVGMVEPPLKRVQGIHPVTTRQFQGQLRIRAGSSLLAGKNGPRIATVKTASIRPSTSAAYRK
jgi:hypothetical protein